MRTFTCKFALFILISAAETVARFGLPHPTARGFDSAPVVSQGFDPGKSSAALVLSIFYSFSGFAEGRPHPPPSSTPAFPCSNIIENKSRW